MATPPPARGARGPANIRSADPMRENLFKLFGRSYVRAERLQPGAGRAVYRGAARMTLDLCGQPWAQATIFSEESKLTRLFLKETGIAAADPEPFVQQSLMANCWASAWTRILLAAERKYFGAYCVAKGEDTLRAALAEKRGVVLTHSHTVFAQLFWRWLEHQGIPEGITLWQWTWNRERKEKEDPKLRAIESAREMLAATRLLRDGGIVHSMADGRWGGDRIEMPFFNRKRVFQPGFAELAVMTGAPVLPVNVILQTDGRIRVDIGTRLTDHAGVKDRNQRVEKLVHEYVRQLTGRWRRYASNVEWFQMARHLKLPQLEKKES